jgi:hypothetical protein
MRTTFATLLIAASAALSGCAAMNNLTSDVSTFSQWPAERKPGSYSFERLPSQQSNPEQQQLLEDSARHALQLAGFTPVDAGKTPEYIVQLGARVSPNDRYYYYDDPLWWRGGLHYSRFGRPRFYPGFYPGFGFAGPPTPTYEREVALLIRDRSSGTPLFEARATNDGGSPSIQSLLPAMYDAALKDFPNGGVNPRRITTEIVKKG